MVTTTITTITISPLSEDHKYHNITIITISPISPRSQYHHYHHYHNITIITISPLSQYHHYHNITNITNITSITNITISPLSPLSQYHHYHNITTTTISPLSQYHQYHNITTITRITISPLSQDHHYHYHHYHHHHHYDHHYHIPMFRLEGRTSVLRMAMDVRSLSDFEGSLAPKLRFHIFHFHFLGKSRTKASFSHLQLSLFEGSLAQKLRFHIFHFHFLREVSHQSFVFTSSTSTFWGKSRTKASFSHLPLPLFEGSLAPKLRFHIFHFHFLREVSHKSFVFTSFTSTFWGKSRTKASFSHLPLPLFEGSLAQKLRFRIFHFQVLREVSHKSFVFTSSTFTFWGKSRTKASFSHLPLPLFEGSLAPKLRFHIFNFHFLREVSHKSFVFTSSTSTFWGKSRTKASFSHLQLALFEGSLAQKLRFHIFHFHFLREVSHQSFVFASSTFRFLREVSHKSFVFTSSTFTFWGKSRTKASFSHLPLSGFWGKSRTKCVFER